MVPQPLLVTKYLVPIVSQPLVQRPRLLGLLEAGLRRKLTVVSAPAGFGKSTLLADWATSHSATEHPLNSVVTAETNLESQIAWVSLEPSDNTPEVFWQYVFMALERTHPRSTAEVLSTLQASIPASLESVLTAFINARLENPVSSVLILDDFHVITNATIHDSLAFLLEHLPPQHHIILLTRNEPPFSLARFRAKREVTEIGQDALRCTPDETASFLRDVMGVQLMDETLAQITARTEGWLVGLQLLGLSLQGRRDPQAVLEELGGSQGYVFDYLMDEVLRQQPEVLQRFLLHTSVLERLNVPLCNALLEQDDAKVVLSRLESSNLFLIALDEHRQWFRYHHLFREALQARLGLLDPAFIRDLHLRASEWFAAHGDSIAMTFHATQAESLSDGLKLPEPQRRAQAGYLAAANAQRAAIWGDAERTRRFASVALTLLPQESLLERSAVASAESTAALCDGDVLSAHQLMRQAATLIHEAGHLIPALAQTAVAALYLHFLGRLQEAEDLLEQTLAQVVQPGDPPKATACLIYVIQAFILLERNQLDSALELVTRGTHLAQQLGFDAAIELGENISGLIQLAHGEHTEAQSALERAIAMPLQLGNPFQQALGATPIQVRLWLAAGQLDRGLAWVEELGCALPLKSVFARERLDVARARVFLAARQPTQALATLSKLIPSAIKYERWDHVIEMWLLEAVAHDMNGDHSEALEALTKAVRQAEPEGYIRRFVDEGSVMALLLSRLRKQQANSGSVAYLDALLGAFTGEASMENIPKLAQAASRSPDSAQLSRRELEVLALLSRGFSNDDIARRLEVSLFTVKSHVGSLLSKLEAKNRTHAVAKARALGLLEHAP